MFFYSWHIGNCGYFRSSICYILSVTFEYQVYVNKTHSEILVAFMTMPNFIISVSDKLHKNERKFKCHTYIHTYKNVSIISDTQKK